MDELKARTFKIDDILIPDPEERVQAIAAALAFLNTLSQEQLHKYLPVLVRLSRECPLQDVQKAFNDFLQTAPINPQFLQLFRETVPSHYIPESEIPLLASQNSDISDIFEEVFLLSGRVSHIQRIAGMHPSWLRHYTSTMLVVMNDDGPLPRPWRHYIAILAATRFHCDVLVSMEQSSFLECGGPPEWLQGVRFAPLKLQCLLETNSLLAHRPWLLKKAHISQLTATKGDAESFSIAEIVHAFVIMTTFHSLCGFVCSMGVAPEADLMDLMAGAGRQEEPVNNHSDLEGGERFEDAEKWLSLMRSDLSSIGVHGSAQHAFQSVQPAILHHSRDSHPVEQKHSQNRFETLQDDEGDSPSSHELDNEPEREGSSGTHNDLSANVSSASIARQFQQLVRGFQPVPLAFSRIHRYMIDIPTAAALHDSGGLTSADTEHLNFLNHLRYTPFDVSSEDDSVFYLHDYSWSDHGFVLINRYYQDLGTYLDEEFKEIYNLTYNSYFDETGIDTSPLRQAIWYYVFRLYGMYHADFNYETLHLFLTPQVKAFVEKIVCDPESMVFQDFDSLSRYKLAYSERCHIALLAFEAHRQASLLYGLHAIMTHMTHT